MNKDIRLCVDFFDHPKTIKLIRNIGYEGIYNLQRLWCFAGKYRPEGIFYDMNKDDIEIAAHWKGEPGAFIEKLCELKWLDLNDEIYSLHGWKDHNGYAIHARDRIEQARKASEIRWKKRTIKIRNAQRNADSIPESNPPIPTPTPLPNPNPLKINTLVSNDKIVFDPSNSEFKNITNSLKEKWKDTYPAINVDLEIKKAECWLKANPKNKKQNYERFINNWLKSTQERAPRVSQANSNGGYDEEDKEFAIVKHLFKTKEEYLDAKRKGKIHVTKPY